MTLNDYKKEIELTEYPRPSGNVSPSERSEICSRLLEFLIKERGISGAFNYNYERKRDLVDSYMTRRAARPIPSEIIKMQDKLLWAETVDRKIVDINGLEYKEGIAIWQGDITRLNAEAIVNSASSNLLGCNIARHHCIDNVIHSRAGMQMRMDGMKLIGLQGHPERCGEAKVTLAYNLPSKYVLHTVGPAAAMGVGETERQQLRSSYLSCLYLAKEMGIRSIAFCCISTGLFGFPSDEAAEIAVGTVRRWMMSNSDYPIKVVFNAYEDRDMQVYEQVFRFM